MTSFIRKRLTYIPFLSGLIFGVLVIAIANSLRSFDNSYLVVLIQVIMALALGFVTGFLLKNSLKHSYLVSISALFYAYALSNLSLLAANIHYGLYAFITGLLAVGLLYLGDVFFNRLKLHLAIKLSVAIVGFIVIFVICSSLAMYILRLMY